MDARADEAGAVISVGGDGRSSVVPPGDPHAASIAESNRLRDLVAETMKDLIDVTRNQWHDQGDASGRGAVKESYGGRGASCLVRRGARSFVA